MGEQKEEKTAKVGIKYNLMEEKRIVSPEFERRNQQKAHIRMFITIYQISNEVMETLQNRMKIKQIISRQINFEYV